MLPNGVYLANEKPFITLPAVWISAQTIHSIKILFFIYVQNCLRNMKIFSHSITVLALIGILHISHEERINKTDIYYKMLRITKFQFSYAHQSFDKIQTERNDCSSWTLKFANEFRQNAIRTKQKTPNRKWRVISTMRRILTFQAIHYLCNENLCVCVCE